MEVTLQSFKNRFSYDPQKDLLGKGGYSEVYKAYDNDYKTDVALKIYQGDYSSQYNLLNEIRKYRRLQHAHVIQHLEAFEVNTGSQDIHGNTIKYQVGILEYANAGTLADLIKQGQVTGLANASKLESIAKDIIAGLEYLHSKNIIHRDLKPSNILLFKDGDKLTPKICDFGIAKIMDNATAVSTQLVGTIEYMAPEYFRTDIGEIGKESDLWSLGVILLEASTGKHPFGKANEGYTNGQIINNILSKELHIELIDQQSTRFVIDYIRKALRIKDIEKTIEEVSEPLTITKKNEEVQNEATKKAKTIDESEKTAIGDSEEEAIDESKEEVIGESKKQAFVETEKETIAEAEKEATIEKAKNDLLIALKLKKEQTRKKRQRLILFVTITAFLVIFIAYGIMQYYKGDNEVKEKKEKLISIDTPTPTLIQKITPIDSVQVNIVDKSNKNSGTVTSNSTVKNNTQNTNSAQLNVEDKNKTNDGVVAISSVNNTKNTNTAVENNSNAPLAIQWVSIPAVTFTMGSPSNESNRQGNESQYDVYLSAFKISKYEVTFEQYDAFCEATNRQKPDDRANGRGKKPVINVNWNDASAFAKWMGCRLPTEAEWEYACKSGTNTAFNTGNFLSVSQANYIDSRLGESKEIGSYSPNSLGLYDMHGNVWEWCSDWYGQYTIKTQVNPKGIKNGTERVIRGGSYHDDVFKCQTNYRSSADPDYHYRHIGFRIVLQ